MKYRCNPFLDKDYDPSNPVIDVSIHEWLLLNLAQWYVALTLIAVTVTGICAIALLSPVIIPFVGIYSLVSESRKYSIADS